MNLFFLYITKSLRRPCYARLWSQVVIGIITALYFFWNLRRIAEKIFKIVQFNIWFFFTTWRYQMICGYRGFIRRSYSLSRVYGVRRSLLVGTYHQICTTVRKQTLTLILVDKWWTNCFGFFLMERAKHNFEVSYN